MGLWLLAEPLVLASKSETRRQILAAAGLPVEIHPADVDERAVERNLSGAHAADIASRLAAEKAKIVSSRKHGRVVVGADQVLALGSERFSKPTSRDAARDQLRMLRGKTHMLYSAVAVARDGAVMFQHVDSARLTMRDFSNPFIESYLDAAGTAATISVGAYQAEGIGINLFERVDGEHFTILGLPLLPLLQFFRREGFVAG
jgi:septum formation protein